MRIHEVRRLIQLVEESEIGELEVWRWWGRIRIRKSVGQNGGNLSVATSGLVREAPPASPAAAPSSSDPSPVEDKVDADAGLIPVKSPMVGTFYRAPAPDAEPYVGVGSEVEPGQTVCIIEAMKLMNEIQSEVRGEIKKILVENNHPVQFGQDLFLVKEK